MDAAPGSLPRPSTGTTVMIHAPAAPGSGQRRQLRPGAGTWFCPVNTDQRWTRDRSPTPTRQDPSAPRRRRVFRQAASRRLSNQAADPKPTGAARECARPRVRARVPGGGSESLVLERAGFWNSPPRPAGTQLRPEDCNRPWRGRPRRARAPCATAPDSSPAPRGQVRRGGRGLRLPGQLPPGPAALACPPGRPRPPAPRPARPPRCATLPKLEAEAGRLHSRRAHRGGGGGEGGDGGGGGGGGGAAKASEAGEAEPARPNADRGGRPRPEQQEEDARRRRRPARESKVGARGCAPALGPGGAAARAPVRPALAGRMGGGAPGPPPPPPAACAPAGRRGRGAAWARPLGRRITVGSRPGRSP